MHNQQIIFHYHYNLEGFDHLSLTNKVTVLDWYDDWLVRSTTWETKVPAVVMLKKCNAEEPIRDSQKGIFLFAIFIPVNTVVNFMQEEI